MTAGSGAPGGGAPGATSGLGLGVGSGTAGTAMGPAANAATGPFGFNQGNVSSIALGANSGNAMGVGPASSPSSTTSVATPVQNANQNAQNSNAVLGLSNIGQSISNAPTSVLGSTTATGEGLGFQVPPVNAVMSSTLGVPVTTTDGGFVTHGNLSGQVAAEPILPSDIETAKWFNDLVDNPLGKMLSSKNPPLPTITSFLGKFLAQAAEAQTPQNVASTRAALALAGPPGPSAAFGGNPLTGTGHPMGLNTGSSGSTPSPTVTAPTTPEVQALVVAFAAAPHPLADHVTVVQPLSAPVQNTLIDVVLQNALAQLQPTQQGGVLPNRVFDPLLDREFIPIPDREFGPIPNRVFDPQIQNTVQQFTTQVV